MSRAHIVNTSFLYAKDKRVSNHKARLKKQNKRKLRVAYQRRLLKSKMLYFWNTNNVYGWTQTLWELNYKNMRKIRTIKKSCLYSDRARSVNPFLALSKYKIADFSRRGLIKDLKKF